MTACSEVPSTDETECTTRRSKSVPSVVVGGSPNAADHSVSCST